MDDAMQNAHTWKPMDGAEKRLWVSTRGWALIIEDAVTIYLCSPDGVPLPNADGSPFPFRDVDEPKKYADREQAILDARPESKGWAKPTGDPILQEMGTATVVGCRLGHRADFHQYEFPSRKTAELYLKNILRLTSGSGSSTHN